MREDLEKLAEQLQERERILDKYTQKRQKFEEQYQKKIDELMALKEQNNEVQKLLETKHLVLQQLENSHINELEQEIKKLEEDNERLNNEWFKQKIEIEGEIEAFRTKTNERKEKLDQMREKIRRLDEENQTIRQEGRQNLERKDKLIEEYQKMPKDASRQIYIKKIGELKNNLEKQRADYKKVQ